MIVAGIMSGTSADGINIAIVQLEDHDFETKLNIVAHREYPFPPNVRKFILSVMNAEAKIADLARLNVLLGELYAEAFTKTAAEAQAGVSLIGCHGQTIYHQGEKKTFLGRPIAATWQTGEGAIIAARTGIPVISDFRQADMAAGGKGAPLVPFLDYMLYRDPQRGRIVQNIGGIANLTAIPSGTAAGGGARPVLRPRWLARRDRSLGSAGRPVFPPRFGDHDQADLIPQSAGAGGSGPPAGAGR